MKTWKPNQRVSIKPRAVQLMEAWNMDTLDA